MGESRGERLAAAAVVVVVEGSRGGCGEIQWVTMKRKTPVLLLLARQQAKQGELLA